MKTPQQALMPNPEQEKNNYLLNILCTTDKILKDNEVFTPDSYNKNLINYVKYHLDEIGEKIASIFQNCRYFDGKIILKEETFCYSISLQNCENMLKDLTTELYIDWDKKCYREMPVSGKSWKERKLTNKWDSQKIPNDFFMYPASAEYYDNAEQIKESPEYNFVCQNIQSAKNGLHQIKLYSPQETAKIKGLERMVKMWEQIEIKWNETYEKGLTLDYKSIVLARFIENNVAIQSLMDQKEITSLLDGLYKNEIYELFTAQKLEPINDINLLFSLKVANEINKISSDGYTRHYASDILKPMGGVEPFEHYLKFFKDTFEKETSNFDERYKLKNTKGFKNISHRDREYRNIQQNNLEKDKNYIQALIKNELTIKKYIK